MLILDRCTDDDFCLWSVPPTYKGGGVGRCFFPLYVDCVFKLMKIQFDLLLKTVQRCDYLQCRSKQTILYLRSPPAPASITSMSAAW